MLFSVMFFPCLCHAIVLYVSDCFAIYVLLFCFQRQLEKDSSRMKVGSRMFRKALEDEVYKREAGGLLAGATSESIG